MKHLLLLLIMSCFIVSCSVSNNARHEGTTQKTGMTWLLDSNDYVIEFHTASALLSGQRLVRVYINGDVLASEHGVTNRYKIDNQKLGTLLTKLDHIGFFEMSDKELQSELSALDSGRAFKRVYTVDGTSKSLQVRTQSKKNSVSLYSLDQLIVHYPTSSSLRRAAEAFTLVEATLVNVGSR